MSELKLPSEIEIWLKSFIKEHGHPPRVLHIGNIANNAYNNAKLLNKAGLDCDVICYDYYHIMGCPEWEDADFEGDIEDQFKPDWDSVDLKGFQRQRWFAQGPLDLCVSYLIARRTGDKTASSKLWRALKDSHPSSWGQRLAEALLRQRKFPAKALLFEELSPRWRNRVVTLRDRQYPMGALLFYALRLAHDGLVCLLLLALTLIVVPLKLLRTVVRWLRDSFKSRAEERARSLRRRFSERAEELVLMFRHRFPDRPDELSRRDLNFLRPLIPIWAKLFRHYDIIQAYSTDSIYPLFAGTPYFAFEHGTLREIPARQTSQGRCASLSYSQATHVFVTNTDCIEVARKLAGDKITFLNHPYDEDHGVNVSGWCELRDRLILDLDADFLFFFPTRHDWVSGTGYADKANDVFIRAFCRLRQNGHRVGMVCCRWGANVKQSQELIAEYGLTKHVLWSEPMGIIRFERNAKAAHVVIDQFKLGAFGGVMFKAMSIGVPMCTYLDEAEMVEQFGEAPPVINCGTEDEIVAKIGKLIGNQAVLDELAAAGRRWIKRHHSSADTVIAQLSCYMKAI